MAAIGSLSITPNDFQFNPLNTAGGSAAGAPAEGAGESLFDSISDGVYGALTGGFGGPEGEGAAAASYSALEISVQASVKRSFEASYQYTGPNGAKTSAYVRASEEISFTASFRLEQAQRLAAAHTTAGGADYFSPEATARRIVDFAMSFFPAYSKDNEEMPFEERVDSFRKMVEGAIDEGFKEALAILGSLPDNVMAGIDETRGLIQQMLDSFFERLKGEGSEEGGKAAEDGSWADFVNGFFEESGQEQGKIAA